MADDAEWKKRGESIATVTKAAELHLSALKGQTITMKREYVALL